MAVRSSPPGTRSTGEQRTREGAEELIEQGLRWCETPRAVAEAMTSSHSVPDDQALEAVASGADGIWPAWAPARPGST